MRLSNPDIDYFKQDVFDAFAFSQVAQIGNLTFLSGVAPLKGSLADLQLVGSNAAEQLQFVLDTIEKCLEHAQLQKENIAAWTFYTTNIAEFSEIASPVLSAWLGEHKPTSTTVEVSALIHPEQKIEIAVIAAK
ncbi:hypothetical protein E0H85_15730 [Acinetobacter terrae]|uniref:RidA family protein n=1 Tax=Acinetobacter terrae TaxID=2731247 RepID=A0A4V2LP28_9GAMM|nr:hypothetical protein E0H85_15730 [Acinetobacter terrae]